MVSAISNRKNRESWVLCTLLVPLYISRGSRTNGRELVILCRRQDQGQPGGRPFPRSLPVASLPTFGVVHTQQFAEKHATLISMHSCPFSIYYKKFWTNRLAEIRERRHLYRAVVGPKNTFSRARRHSCEAKTIFSCGLCPSVPLLRLFVATLGLQGIVEVFGAPPFGMRRLSLRPPGGAESDPMDVGRSPPPSSQIPSNGPLTPREGAHSPLPPSRVVTGGNAVLDSSRDARTPTSVDSRLRAMHTPGGAAAKRSAGDAGAPSRGTGSQRRGKKRGRFGTPRTRSQRQGAGTRVGRQMQRTVSMRLADVAPEQTFDEQQKEAREQAKARKETAALAATAVTAAADIRRPPGVGQVHGVALRHRRGGGSTFSPAKAPQKGGDGRRRRACGLDKCGWVTPAPGVACRKCPSQQVHDAGQRLCSACHRPTDDANFTHLREQRRKDAKMMAEEWRAPRGRHRRPACVVADFQPGAKSCLCQRGDCFVAALVEWRKRDEQVRCVDCNKAGRRGLAGDKWRNVGQAGGDAVYSCGRCYCNRRRSADGNTNVSSKAGGHGGSGGAPQRSCRDPRATVHEMVAELVGRGEIVCCEDVIRRLQEERAKVDKKPLQQKYARQVVKEVFRAVAIAADSKARVVESDGGRNGNGDGREKPLFLFPEPLSDEVVVGYYVRAHQHIGDSVPVRLARSEAPLDDVGTKEGESSARMDVVRRAARIVREDVENKKCLKNAPGRGSKHQYGEELGMEVKDPREALLDFPATLVALLQGVTGFGLGREVVGAEREGATFVWEDKWHEEVLADARESRVPTQGSGEPGGGAARTSPLALPPATTIPESLAAEIAKENKDRRSKHRRVYMLCCMLVKAVVGDKYIASHDIKGTQWAKTKGCPREVIDFCAGMGLWATTARLQHREDWFVRQAGDKDIIDKNAECAAIPLDNCDKDISVPDAQGEGPHYSCIAATITTRGPEVGRLEDASKLRRREDLHVNDVLEGPQWEEEGGRRYQTFEDVLYAAVVESVKISSGGDNELTCLEVVLRKVCVSTCLRFGIGSVFFAPRFLAPREAPSDSFFLIYLSLSLCRT